MLTQGDLIAERYKLVKLLGRGGFSEVWLAQDVLTNIDIAIKIYASSVELDDDGINLFTQEFSLVFDTNHTNLLHPTHYDCWERKPYLILPYCKKGSALSFIKDGATIPEEECWKLLLNVASGLAFLHAKNPPIIHQDIKPDNILIGDDGQYMITDFGISARIRSTIGRSQSSSGNISGTLSYMGPERFGATPTPIMASDIWSLGATLFELMTGMPPYENYGGVLQKNGADIPVIANEYSEELKDIVYQCLALNTWDRPTAQEIVEFIHKNHPDINASNPITGSVRPLEMIHSVNDSKAKVQSSQPIQAKDPKKALKIGGIAALVVLLLIGGIVVLNKKEPEPVVIEEQVPTINYDSICYTKMNQARVYQLKGDSLFYPLEGKIQTDSLFEDAYIKAFQIYQEANNEFKNDVSRNVVLELENSIKQVHENLDSISNYFDKIITVMDENGFEEESNILKIRKEKIQNSLLNFN